MGWNSCAGALRLSVRPKTTITVDGSFTGTRCRKIALAKVKMVVLAPMPSVREIKATAVNAGRFVSMRAAYFRSCRKVSIAHLEGVEWIHVYAVFGRRETGKVSG